MKIFACCLAAVLLSSAFAFSQYEENTVENKEDSKAADRSSDSKPKRDAAYLASSYHGPSYKYLPPSSVPSSYNSYVDNRGITPLTPGIGRGYISDGGYFRHFAHGPRYVLKNVYHSNGYHGLGYNSGNFVGHEILPQSNSIKGGIGSLSADSFNRKGISGGHVNSYAPGHGYSITENGYKLNSHSTSGGYKGGYNSYFNNLNSNIPLLASNGLSSGHPPSSSLFHSSDHVHNGGQEHTYVIASGSPNFDSGHHKSSELLNNSYLPPVQQLPIPSTNYGSPKITAGDTLKKKNNRPTSLPTDQGPSYAAGHKGLGHFSFIANKPQALHTSISSSSQIIPSFSKAPFKPSTLLGIKHEGNSQENFPYQNIVPSSAIVSNPTGYDYATSQENLQVAAYQKEHYPQFVEIQSSSKSEPDSTYLPPSSNEGSSNYLIPTNTYENSYSN